MPAAILCACSLPLRDQRPRGIRPVPLLCRGGFRVSQGNDGEGARPTELQAFGEAVHQFDIVRVAEDAPGTLQGDPLEGFDLVVRDEGGVGDRQLSDLRLPVVHDLRPTGRHRVLDGAERGAERDREAGLLGDLAHRALRQGLTRVELALGQRDILMLRAVHEQHLHLAVEDLPAHGTSREHRRLLRGWNRRHRFDPVRRRARDAAHHDILHMFEALAILGKVVPCPLA